MPHLDEFTWNQGGAYRVAIYAGERPVSFLKIVDRPILIDEQTVKVGGVSAVITCPEMRRKGFGTLALQEAECVIFKMTKLMLERGADWKHPVHQAVLHNAAAHGHTAVIRVLLDSGVDVNSAIPCGLTALQYAIAGSHAEAAQLLRNRGALM